MVGARNRNHPDLAKGKRLNFFLLWNPKTKVKPDFKKELEVRNGEPSRTQGIILPCFSYLYFLYIYNYFSFYAD